MIMIIQDDKENLSDETILKMENKRLRFIIEYLKCRYFHDKHEIKRLKEHIKWLQNR